MSDRRVAADWDRFAHWPIFPARLALIVFAALLVLSALAPIRAGEDEVKAAAAQSQSAAAKPERPRDEDLQLYDNVIVRMQRGENYYDAVAVEHRASNYPLRPGLAVRLPTLAWIETWAGLPVQIGASLALLLAILAAWWRRLGEEPGGLPIRTVAIAALAFGASIVTVRYFFVLHELWAGALLALSLGLHRPGNNKWLGALLAAAAALSIREHVLPFVLLMATYALWHRRWREGAAWLGLIALFLASMTVHLGIVAGYARPTDPMGPSWLTFRALGGWLSMVVLSSNLRLLPHVIGGPLVMLMMLGWAGWRSAAGTFCTLLFLGYGLAFMIAGRGDNWYWGMVVAPTMFIGLALVSRVARSLWRAAFPSRSLASRGGRA